MVNISENALKILEKRYFAKDEEGKCIEDALGMFRRVANAAASAEYEYVAEGVNEPNLFIEHIEQEFLDMMVNLEFLPNSPTLMNAGRPLGQLSACFVLPIDDDTVSIFDSIKNAALIHKSGGGTGFSFSRLRPNGSIVKSTKGVASGPVSFLKVFNAATECIKQGGTRRGANMGILRVDHPDILEFIRCKQKGDQINSFNLSVGLTEEFMQAVIVDYIYRLYDPTNGKAVNVLHAKEVFDEMVNMAWNNGEPGIVFLDRINRDNPTPHLGNIESTNPCGEQPLLPYESCNLGSINLSKFLKHEGAIQAFYDVDWDKLQKTIIKAVRFLDNIITINKFPIPEIEKATLVTRKIGLGVMGWADLLIKMKIPYGSDHSIELAEKIMSFINNTALKASKALVDERGSYPVCDPLHDLVRNATRTTIAPTGTLSIIANCSSGIEPLFAIVMERNQADMKMLDTNPLFLKSLEEHRIPISFEMLEDILKKGSIKNIDLPEDIKSIFPTAHDITPEQHIKMQAAFQKHTDNAVSKTINFKHNATKEDIYNAFMLAYNYGCKGITIYRDGSRNNQVLSTGASYSKPLVSTPIQPRTRPESLRGFTEKIQIGCGKLYVTVNSDESGIAEVFTNTGRGGGCTSQSEATARLISLALRSGIDPQAIIDQLKGIRCSSTIGKNLKCTSCPDAIGKAIESALNESLPIVMKARSADNIKPGDFVSFIPCPNCKSALEHDGGCVICRNCGYSKCE